MADARMTVGGGNHIDGGNLSNPWFCVQTEPKQEHHALLSLSAISVRGHFPQIVTRQRRYGKVEATIRPLFPGYILATFDPLHDQWGLIYRARGVRRVMTNAAGRPIPLRRGEIERLMAMGRAGDGVIDDEAPAFPRIPDGAPVRIIDGPFADWSGVCKWSSDERIGVLMTLFNTEKIVPMPRALVERVHT